MIEGVVRGGVVVLDSPSVLSEGTRVTVAPAEQPGQAATPTGQMLLKYVGTADALPEDMAENHDHYLHGQAKR